MPRWDRGRGGDANVVNFASLPIAAHLSKATPPPHFTNRKEDWPEFVRKFDVWSRNLSGGRTLNETQQLQLLNSCLPEVLQKEIQLWEKEKNRKIKFVELFALLEAKFGRAQSESMRKRWLEVQLPKGSGKCSVQTFDEFRVHFKLACAYVPDVTKEEARRVLLEKLTPFMRKYVVEAESKKMRERPVCEIALPASLSAERCRVTVTQWAGAPPSQLAEKGGGSLFGWIF